MIQFILNIAKKIKPLGFAGLSIYDVTTFFLKGLIEGAITENQYKNNEAEIPVLTVSKLMAEKGTYFINDDIGLHSLHNSKNKRAMSLHVYVNPIEECSYYSKKLKEYKTKNLSYDTPAIF